MASNFMAGLVSFFIKGIITLVNTLKTNRSIGGILGAIISNLPTLIGTLVSIGRLNSKEKIDEFLAALDEYTGSDPAALDIFKNLPPGAEEHFWDGIKEAARVQLYAALNVPLDDLQGNFA